jgi:hypothetical protein
MRMRNGLGSLGDALEAALGTAKADGRELQLPNVDRRLVLTMIRVYRKPAQRGLMTLSACERVAGDIIQGPFASRHDAPTVENLERFLKAHRWVLNPVHMGDGRPNRDGIVKRPAHTIVGPPTISLMHRIETKCTACGHTDQEWKDVVIMRSSLPESEGEVPAAVAVTDETQTTVAASAAATPEGAVATVEVTSKKKFHGRVTHWSPTIVTSCNKCGCSPVSQRKLWCTALRKREKSADDPVIFQKDREAVLERLLQAWQEGPPEDGQPTLVLPRVWAVYESSAIPDPAWKPSDPWAVHIGQRLQAFQQRVENAGVIGYVNVPHGMLPFGVARQYHQPPEPISKAVKDFRLEPAHHKDASPEAVDVAVGWASMADLLPDEKTAGWRRRLWHDPRQPQEMTEDEIRV